MENNNLKTFDSEMKKKYYADYVCGMDESGRGAFVGPLVAASVIMPEDYYNPKIKDSKKTTEKQRIELEQEIKENAVFFEILAFDCNIIQYR